MSRAADVARQTVVVAVSDRDRSIFARQQAVLSAAESDDERTDDDLIAAADVARSATGVGSLAPWWSTKTEPELHHRARALGLLRRVR
jgi:hypothetical protein